MTEPTADQRPLDLTLRERILALARHVLLLRTLGRVFSLLRRLHAPLRYLAASVLLSFLAIVITTYLYTLFFPLIQGLVLFDFTGAGTLPVLRTVISVFPTLATSTRLFVLLVIWIFLLSLLKNALLYAASTCLFREASATSQGVRSSLFEHYLRFGKLYYDRHRTSELASLLQQSSTVLTMELMVLQHFCIQVFSLAAYLSIMLWISWQLTLLLGLLFPLLSFGTHALRNRLHRYSLEHQSANILLGTVIHDLLGGMTTVRGFGKENIARAKLREYSDEEIKRSLRINTLATRIPMLEDTFSVLGFLIAALSVLVLIHLGYTFSTVQLFVFVYLGQKVMPCINALNVFTLRIASGAGPMEQLAAALTLDTDKHILPDGDREFPGLTSSIALQNLHFSYSPDKPALRGVNLMIRKGRKTALVGSTGSGKSTIMHLLLRFYDCPPGSILVDGTDIRDFSIRSLRDRMAFVSQDIALFDDTIEANIRFASENVSAEKLQEVIRKARLEHVIASLPKGLQTRVGERGTQLSGGEKQRIAIARALLRNADILLLDEATNALDPDNEAQVTAAIRELTEGKTVIVIAHRLQTIKDSDAIAVLDHGTVIAEGTFDELMAQDPEGTRFGWQQTV